MLLSFGSDVPLRGLELGTNSNSKLSKLGFTPVPDYHRVSPPHTGQLFKINDAFCSMAANPNLSLKVPDAMLRVFALGLP